MAGRPRFLCETKQREICMLVATGCSMEAAAGFIGCGTLTIRREVRRNPQFGERLRRARATAEITPIQTMRQAAKSEWRAAAWLLERTQPQQYAKRAAHSFSQEDVATLLSRACEVFRRETRDTEKFARIKRSVTALLKTVVVNSTGADDPAFVPTTSPVAVEIAPKDHKQPAAETPLLASAAHLDEQNGSVLDDDVICMADIKPRYAESYARPVAAE